MKGTFRRIAIGIATGAVAVAALALPAAADTTSQVAGGPILAVQNPTSGDTLPRGKQYFFGLAYDPAAKSGSGVDRVQVYAGDRDAGAFWLGTAVATKDVASYPVGLVTGSLGLLNPVAIGTQWANNRWRIKTPTLKKTMSGTLFFYARSSVSSKETVVQIQNISIDPGRNLNRQKP